MTGLPGIGPGIVPPFPVGAPFQAGITPGTAPGMPMAIPNMAPSMPGVIGMPSMAPGMPGAIAIPGVPPPTVDGLTVAVPKSVIGGVKSQNLVAMQFFDTPR